MRPLRLTLQAFAAFGGEQEIDFGRLGEHRLFLIHGPTGAGKTSVLDGLCYALFGESSGDERGPAHLRSHHAPPGLPTLVEYDFALGPAARYRIRRSPKQERPKLRGSGTVTVQGEAALWQLGEDGAAATLLAEGDRVAAALETLLGYKAAEFRQVVLLPQGRFRELLTAKPGDRQRILATLFRTRFYERIQIELAELAKTATQEVRRLEERRRVLLGQADAETPDAAAAARAALAAEAEVAAARQAAAAQAAQAARQAEEAGRTAAALLARAAESAQRRAALEAEAPATEAARARLAAAQRAARLEGPAAAWRATIAAEAEARAAAARAAEADATARAALNRATAALAEEAARETAEQAAQAEATRLAGLVEDAGRTAAAADAARAAATEAEQAEARRHQAAGALAEARAAAEAAAAGLAARSAKAAQRERHQFALQAAEAEARDAMALADLATEIATRTAGLRHAEATGNAAAERLQAARAAREAATRARLGAEAAHLAATLAAGEPCPVCGSPHHPRPAVAPEGVDALPDGEAAAATAEAAAQDAYDAARIAYAELRAALRAAEERHAALTERFAAGRRLAEAQDGLAAAAAPAAEVLSGDAATVTPAAEPPADAAARAMARAAAARAALRAARSAEAALPALRAAADRATTAVTGAEQTLAAAEAAARQAADALAGSRAAHAALLERLPPEAAEPAVLRDRAASAGQRAATLREALRRDRDARAAAAAAAEAAARGAAEMTARAAVEARRRAMHDADFTGRCAEAGFASIAAFEAARLPPAETDALAERIARFDQALATARAAEAEASAAAAGLAPPDLPALDRTAREAAAALTAATQQAAALRQRLADADRLLAEIAEAGRALEAARAALELRQDLADLAAGKNAQKLSLEGFVLRSLLDEALAAANRRLRAMLHGRYQVRRVEEPERKNVGVGLDIEVLDEWNGGVRPPGTLSGGEGFCTALALALGLADTVQAHAGARRIDALFVDEGFGTLDEEALDTAMEVLTGLGAGGDRLVGIISHVADLRMRIPARLEVTPGRRGSAARFRIG